MFGSESFVKFAFEFAIRQEILRNPAHPIGDLGSSRSHSDSFVVTVWFRAPLLRVLLPLLLAVFADQAAALRNSFSIFQVSQSEWCSDGQDRAVQLLALTQRLWRL
jgi:hypothetical protein